MVGFVLSGISLILNPSSNNIVKLIDSNILNSHYGKCKKFISDIWLKNLVGYIFHCVLMILILGYKIEKHYKWNICFCVRESSILSLIVFLMTLVAFVSITIGVLYFLEFFVPLVPQMLSIVINTHKNAANNDAMSQCWTIMTSHKNGVILVLSVLWCSLMLYAVLFHFIFPFLSIIIIIRFVPLVWAGMDIMYFCNLFTLILNNISKNNIDCNFCLYVIICIFVLYCINIILGLLTILLELKILKLKWFQKQQINNNNNNNNNICNCRLINNYIFNGLIMILTIIISGVETYYYDDYHFNDEFTITIKSGFIFSFLHIIVVILIEFFGRSIFFTIDKPLDYQTLISTRLLIWIVFFIGIILTLFVFVIRLFKAIPKYKRARSAHISLANSKQSLIVHGG